MSVVLNQASNAVAVGNLFWDNEKEALAKTVNTVTKWMDVLGCGSLVTKGLGVLSADFKNTLTLVGLKDRAINLVETPAKLYQSVREGKVGEVKANTAKLWDEFGTAVTNLYDVTGLFQGRSIALLNAGLMAQFGILNAVALTALMARKTWDQMINVVKLVHDMNNGVEGAKWIDKKIADLNKKKLGGTSAQIQNKQQLLTRELLVLAKNVSTLAMGVLLMYGLCWVGELPKMALLVASTAALVFHLMAFGLTYWNKSSRPTVNPNPVNPPAAPRPVSTPPPVRSTSPVEKTESVPRELQEVSVTEKLDRMSSPQRAVSDWVDELMEQVASRPASPAAEVGVLEVILGANSRAPGIEAS